jgi:hypothetical protein
MDVEDDIAGDVAAALKQSSGEGESAAAAALAPAPAPAEPAATGTPDDRPAQARDASGKFAAKAADAAAADAQAAPAAASPLTDHPAAAATEAPAEPIRPPASWSAPAKSKFPTLDPEVQAEIAKRERAADAVLAERAALNKRLEPIEQAIQPIRNQLAMNGVDDATYIRSLVAADAELRGPNRVRALAQVAQMYGIDLRQLGGQPGQPGQQPPADPRFQQLASQVDNLVRTVTQQQSATQAAEAARVQAELDAFARDNLYFENVKPEMVAFLRSGVSDNLADAYRRACWARDDIRPLLLKDEETKRQAAAAETARAKAAEARQAAGSVTGSPAPGASPAQAAANANSSIEDDVRAAWAAHASAS